FKFVFNLGVGSPLTGTLTIKLSDSESLPFKSNVHLILFSSMYTKVRFPIIPKRSFLYPKYIIGSFPKSKSTNRFKDNRELILLTFLVKTFMGIFLLFNFLNNKI